MIIIILNFIIFISLIIIKLCCCYFKNKIFINVKFFKNLILIKSNFMDKFDALLLLQKVTCR